MGGSLNAPPNEHRLHSHWRLIFLWSNQATPIPLKRLRRVSVSGVSFTPSDTEVVQGGFIVALALIAWLHFEIVSCGQPLVDGGFKAGHEMNIEL
jgi:hypothetical protein